MHTVVERELELALVLSPDQCVPVPARLVYQADDPFAVHVVFHIGSHTPVSWTFSRELLLEGVSGPCGCGDVRIWPTRVDGRRKLCLALSAPGGNALLEAPLAPVASWLVSTLRVVPPGTEHHHLELDGALCRLLEPQPRDELLSDPGPGSGDGPPELDA